MKKTYKEIQFFLIAGISAVTIDSISYYFLLKNFSTDKSKFLSFICGSFCSFLINKYYTFNKQKVSYSESIKFILLYTFALNLNVFTNSFVLRQFQSIIFAFLIATLLSAVTNFIGQKFWVFK
ncbi:MAG: hypothetical protein COB02_04890 [Candidatus Cloacimonadota bacterium]|nr:MAG: hypothetical protein COB02_04890 [Candidatus Cloacimonadota bacterium]